MKVWAELWAGQVFRGGGEGTEKLKWHMSKGSSQRKEWLHVQPTLDCYSLPRLGHQEMHQGHSGLIVLKKFSCPKKEDSVWSECEGQPKIQSPFIQLQSLKCFYLNTSNYQYLKYPFIFADSEKEVWAGWLYLGILRRKSENNWSVLEGAHSWGETKILQ